MTITPKSAWLARATESAAGSVIRRIRSFAPAAGKWDADACYKPFAILDGDRWLLWYNGRRGGTEQIGLATHAGIDLGF